MDDISFEYNGRRVFIDSYQDRVTMDIVFRLFDITDLKIEELDSSEKELMKIEILDYLKYEASNDIDKYLVATRRVLSTDIIDLNTAQGLLEIRSDLLKELDK